VREKTVVFRLPRGASAGVLRRRLSRQATVKSRPEVRRRVEFLDTFDGRLRRADLTLSREGARLVLREGQGGVAIAAWAWRRSRAPRTADELPPGEARERVSAVIRPRALLPAFTADIRTVVMEVGWRHGHSTRVRWERVAVPGKTSRRAVQLVVAERVRGREREAVARALSGSGARERAEGWYSCLRRVAGERGEAGSRPCVPLAPDTPLRAAAAGVFRHLLRIMEANEAGVRDDIDPEFLHDYRVALRRTRTALAQMKGVLPAASARRFRAQFAELSHACGRLRDLDVELLRRGEYEAMLPVPLRAGLAGVFELLARARAQEQGAFAGVLAGAPYRRLKREWRAAVRDLDSGASAGLDADEPVLRVARELARRHRDRVLAAMGEGEPIDDAGLHRARIEVKKLRYVIEFFAVLLPGADGVIERLGRVQDALGEYNDLRQQTARLGDALGAVAPRGRSAIEQAAAMGAVLATLERRRAKARARCARRLAELSGRAFSRAFARVAGDAIGPEG
jgi:CHAD domain-containing protein